SIPLVLSSSGPHRGREAVGWTPLTRDGGQQLGSKFQLDDMASDKNINFRCCFTPGGTAFARPTVFVGPVSAAPPGECAKHKQKI
ncbi:hypothetical protein DD595_18485, partial [Enterobacter cloacae complex sp. 4DZ3-17B2]